MTTTIDINVGDPVVHQKFKFAHNLFKYRPKRHKTFDGVWIRGVACCWLHIDLADHGHQGWIGKASIEPRKLGNVMDFATAHHVH